MVKLDYSKKGKGRSSVTVDKNLRRFIDDLKDELEETLGTKLTDIDVMYHILENYKKEIGLLTIATKLIEKTNELIVKVEDYEKLKEENEELRREIEELRRVINERGGYIEDYESAKEQFCDFLKKEIG
jgi:hypothetical protein